MGMVDLQDYHSAVHLDQLKHWFSPSDAALFAVEKGINETDNLNYAPCHLLPEHLS